MKTIWKWVLGILIVVVVIAAVGMAALAWRNNERVAFMPPPAHSDIGPQPRGHEGGQVGPMQGDGFDRFHQPGPMNGRQDGRQHMPFGGGFLMPIVMIWMRMIPFALTILILVAAYQMGKRAGVLSVIAANPGLKTASVNK
jgi:hypothetical protein